MDKELFQKSKAWVLNCLSETHNNKDKVRVFEEIGRIRNDGKRDSYLSARLHKSVMLWLLSKEMPQTALEWDKCRLAFMDLELPRTPFQPEMVVVVDRPSLAGYSLNPALMCMTLPTLKFKSTGRQRDKVDNSSPYDSFLKIPFVLDSLWYVPCTNPPVKSPYPTWNEEVKGILSNVFIKCSHICGLPQRFENDYSYFFSIIQPHSIVMAADQHKLAICVDLPCWNSATYCLMTKAQMLGKARASLVKF